jgi:Ca2+-binding EF-hand superfamily protein
MRRFLWCGAALTVLMAPQGLLAGDDAPPGDSGPAALFDKLDANQDGLIAADEVPGEQKQLFDRLVRKSDGDGNGQLSKAEFVAALVDSRPERADDAPQEGPGAELNPEAMFDRLDRNGDGKIVLDEVPEPARERIRNLIGLADRDNDRALSREELRRAAQPQPATPPGTPEEMLERLKLADADGDGKLSPEEAPPRLQENFDRIDANQDGFLDEQELKRLFMAAGEGAQLGQELLRRIKQADANGDGKLSQDEAPERLKEQFARIDANQDGLLDEQELRRALQGLAQRMGDGLRDRLKRADRNGDGKISREEATGPLKRNFDTMDGNQDGFIDEGEARQMFRFRPKQDPDRKGPDSA